MALHATNTSVIVFLFAGDNNLSHVVEEKPLYKWESNPACLKKPFCLGGKYPLDFELLCRNFVLCRIQAFVDKFRFLNSL